MKIGLVGNQHMLHDIRPMIDTEDLFIEIVEYPCSRAEMIEVVEHVQGELDAILFAGHQYFSAACRNIVANIPWTYPKRTTNAFLRAVLQAIRSGVDISRITCDIHSMNANQIAGLLCDELDLEAKSIEVYHLNVNANHLLNTTNLACDLDATTMEYHLENFQSGRVTVCFSTQPFAVKKLKEQGYPAYLIQTTVEDVNEAINELRLRHQIYVQQEKDGYQVAVVDLSVQMEKWNRRGIWEYRQMRNYHQLEDTIRTFAQRMGAVVERYSETHYMIYTSKAELDITTGKLTKFGFVKKMQAVTDVKCVTLGIGYGATHCIAKNNAQDCGAIAQKQEWSCYYMMEGDGTPAGPFGLERTAEEKNYSQIFLERVSQETGVGIAVLKNLVKAQAQYGLDAVTAGQLAEMCGMSVNNMNRIVSKLGEKGYVQIVDFQSRRNAGRPPRLLRLKLGTTI